MANKLLISVSPTQVSAAHWHTGNIATCDVFSHDDEGLRAFKEYLAPVRDLPVHMSVDAVEEDYRFESLPHSFGGERAEMVNRKLKQHYRNTPYCSATLQGRDPGKRRDDRYLFCALTNPDLINAWIQAVIECNLPVAGIYLLPTVTQGLVTKLRLRQTNLLVVSIHSAGMRLTFFRDQKLRISRLARIDGTSPQALKNYSEEVSNTRLYLHALRIMTLDEQLAVVIVDHDNTLVELAQVIALDSPNIECSRLGRQDILSKLGVSASALATSSDALYLHLLGLSVPASNLALANITASYRQHQARRGLYALTSAMAVAALAWCAFNLSQIFVTQSDTDAAVRQTSQYQAEYQAITRQFPAAPTSAENLKRTVEVSQRLGTVIRSPESMLVLVSHALDSHPAIVLKTVGWKYGTTDIDIDPVRGAKSLGEAAPAATPGASTRRQSGLIEGEVRPFRGDFRSAIEEINRFAATLSKQPAVAEVRIVKLPLNINPGLALSGNTTDSRDQAGKAEFKLLLVLKQAT